MAAKHPEEGVKTAGAADCQMHVDVVLGRHQRHQDTAPAPLLQDNKKPPDMSHSHAAHTIERGMTSQKHLPVPYILCGLSGDMAEVPLTFIKMYY